MARGVTTLQIKILADAANARSVFARFGRDVRRMFQQLNLSRGRGTPGNDLAQVAGQIQKVTVDIQKAGNAAGKTAKKTKSWTAELMKARAAYTKYQRIGADPLLMRGAEKDVFAVLNKRRQELAKLGAKAKPEWAASLKSAHAGVLNLTGAMDKMYVQAAKFNTEINRMGKLGQRMGLYGKDIAATRAGFSPERLKHVEGEIKQVQKIRAKLAHEIREARSLGTRRPAVMAEATAFQHYAEQESKKWGARGRIAPEKARAAVISDKDLEVLRKYKMATADLPQRASLLRSFVGDVRSFISMQLRWFAAAGTIFALAGAFSAAVRGAIDFYQSLKNIQAVTGVTDEQITHVGDAAIRVARTTPIAANEAAKMGLKLIQAGLSAEQTAVAMETVAAVTTVSGESMTESSKAITTAMFAWKFEAKDIPKIGNILAAAMNFSRLTVEDLGTAFNYLAATSSIMNRTLAETAANMSIISNMGVRASTIGTGLGQLYAKLLNPSKEFREELARLGVSLNDVNPTMQRLAEITRTLTEAGFDAAKAYQMLGQRAGRILATAIVAGADAFDEMQEKIERSEQLTTGLEKAMEGTSNALKKLRNELGVIAVRIGSVAVPALKVVTAWLTKFVGVIGSVAEGIGVLSRVAGPLFTGVLLATVPIIALAVKHSAALSFAMLDVRTSVKLASKAMVFFRFALAAVSAHPFIAAALALAAVLGVIGALFSRNRQKALDNAKAQRELYTLQDGMGVPSTEALTKAQQSQEKALTHLRELWAETALVIPKMPFIDTLQALQDKIVGTLVKMKELRAEFEKVKAQDLSEVFDFYSMDFAAGAGVVSDRDVLGPASPTQEYLRGLDRKTADIKAGVQDARNLLQQFKEGNVVAQALNEAVKDHTRTDISRVTEMYKALYSEYDQKRVAIQLLVDKYDKAIGQEEKEKLYKDIVAEVAKVDLAALKRAPEIIQISEITTKQWRKASEGAANAFSKAKRDVVALKNKLADMVSFDPFRKLNASATSSINDIQTKIDKLGSQLKLLGREKVSEEELRALAEKHGLGALKDSLKLREQLVADIKGTIAAHKEEIQLTKEELEIKKKRLELRLQEKEDTAVLKANLDFLKTTKAAKLEILQVELALLEVEKRKILADKELSDRERRALLQAKEGRSRRLQEDLDAQKNQWKALTLGFKRTSEEWGDIAKHMKAVGGEAASSLQGSFSGMFFDGMRGEMNSFRDYWDSFWESMGKIVSDMLAKMLVNYIFTQAQMQAGSLGGKGGLFGSVLGMVGGLFGGGTATPAGTAGGMTTMFAHSGGLIPRFHGGGLADDERHAILQTGEYVINRRDAQKNLGVLTAINNGKQPGQGRGDTHNHFYIQANDAKSFDDMIRRNPASITNVVSKDIKKAGRLRDDIQAYT